MTRGVYSIFDEKASVYGPLFLFGLNGEGIRWFSDLVNGKNEQISAHRSDYSLYKLGDYDEKSGQVCGVKTPQLVVRGSDFPDGKDKAKS